MSGTAKTIQGDREAFAIDLFLHAYDRPHGAPRRPATDPPDFFVDIAGECLGVELTETVEQRRREREELGFKIIRQAQRRYEEVGRAPLYVWIRYQDMPLPNHQAIPEGIVRLISSIRPETLAVYQERVLGSEDLKKFDLPFIASIRVTRKPDGKANTWGKTDAGTAHPLTRENVEQIIRRKEHALRQFLANPGCTPWLVIYTFDDRVSGSADLTLEAATVIYSSRFEKVFVLNAARSDVVELNTVRFQAASPEF